MLLRSLLAAGLTLALAAAHAQSNDANLQNLLAGLVNGAEVTMLTPLANGMVQVTSFKPPRPLPEAEAYAAIESARQHLAAVGIENPTADQFARALVGGPIDTRDGPVDLPGVLPAGGQTPSEREAAVQQLAAIGILNPSEDQIRTALVGGTISTINGVYRLPGVNTR